MKRKQAGKEPPPRRGEVLVAILNNPRDFVHVADKRLKERWPPRWLAFFDERERASRKAAKNAELEASSAQRLGPFPTLRETAAGLQCRRLTQQRRERWSCSTI
jgi:hypothetical protein